MVDLPVRLDGTDHMCCGEARHVGETVRIWLAFSRVGQVEVTGRPDEIIVLDEGKVSIVGTADGKAGSDGPFGRGTLIASGDMQFAIHGEAPGPRVQCVGELYEARHGEPCGTTTGQLVAIRVVTDGMISGRACAGVHVQDLRRFPAAPDPCQNRQTTAVIQGHSEGTH